jgi:hypothetical protein
LEGVVTEYSDETLELNGDIAVSLSKAVQQSASLKSDCQVQTWPCHGLAVHLR